MRNWPRGKTLQGLGLSKTKKKMAMIPAKEGGSMSYQCPILTSTNYLVWAIKVKAIMDSNGIWEAIEPPRGINVDPKKSKMALAFLFQAIQEELVLQMASHTDAKQVGEGLKTRFLGVDRVRTARLSTLRKEIKSLHMKEDDLVDAFASKLSGLASKARSFGSDIEEKVLVRRLLDAMPKSFLQIVASIEQCFDLDKMSFEEAVGRLRAYEERIKGLNKEEETQGRLMFSKREKVKKQGCEQCGYGSSNRDDFGSGRGRGRGPGKGQGGERFQRNKSHVRCCKCGKLGHFLCECPKWEKKENANLAQYMDDEPTLL